MPLQELTVEQFLNQAGVSVGELDEEASKPQPSALSLANYHALTNRLALSHPGFNFDSKSRRLRVQKRGALPSQILKALQNAKAWERELQALNTCNKADQVLEVAECEMRLLDRMGNTGLTEYQDDNPLKRQVRKRKWCHQDQEGDELRERADALNV